LSGTVQQIEDTLLRVHRWLHIIGLVGVRFEAQGFSIDGQAKLDGVWGLGSTVLNVETDLVVTSSQKEIGISPGMEFAGPAQCLSCPDMSCAFAGMMNQENGAAVGPLEPTQMVQERGDFASDIFVYTMKPDEWVEDDQNWLMLGDRKFQAGAIFVTIQAQGGVGDDLDGQPLQAASQAPTETIQSVTDDGQCILGREQEHGASTLGLSTIQAGSARGDRDGQGEGAQ
jgi:hypothetical protein